MIMTKRPPNRQSRRISEAKLRKIIRQELMTQFILEEGTWDDVKMGVKKIKQDITKGFKGQAVKWANVIVSKISDFSTLPNDVKKILQVIKTSMSETGESFELDETLKTAKELGGLKTNEILSIVNKDLEGPVHEKAVEINKEGVYYAGIYQILIEEKYINNKKV